jgi:signal peptidase I
MVHRGDRGFDYVRRVVGLEGDRVEWDGETLTINGKPLAVGPCEPEAPSGCHTELLGGHRWRVVTTGARSLPGTWDVPAGHVFALGDNRENSLDSRSIGPIPLDAVKGVARVIHFSWPTVSRIGRPLDLAP